MLKSKCIRILVNIGETDSCRLYFASLNVFTFASVILHIGKEVQALREKK